MRIAIFTDTYPPFINGVSTSTYNLVKVLEAHGHETLVVTPRSDDGKLEVKENVIYIPGIALKKIYGYRLTTLFSEPAFKYIKDFENLVNQENVTKVCSVSADGLSEILSEQIDLFSEDEFNTYLSYHLARCEREELFGFTSHMLYICKKN